MKWAKLQDRAYNAAGMTAKQADLIHRFFDKLTGTDRAAEDQFLDGVYKDLRRLANHYMRTERRGHTLQPTALVNEALLRMSQDSDLKVSNRGHFFAIAAKTMRRVLVDHARGVHAKKRGGSKVSLDSVVVFAPEQSAQLLQVHEALERLAAVDPRQAQVVELRFFGGLELDDIARTLNVSLRTIKRDWSLARTWLYRELTKTA